MADDPAITESPLPETGVLLYADALDHLTDYLGGSSADVAQRLTRRAVIDGYNRLMNETDWACLRTHGRINLVANYDTGTVDFDLTGGSSERLWTLASGTWPAWAKYGHLNVDNVIYDIDQRLGTATLTGSQTLSPAADVAAGTSYNLYRNVYPLPSNFKRLCEPTTEHVRRTLYVAPEDFLWAERHRRQQGYPLRWTIMPSVNREGLYSIYLYGYPTQAETLDFIYQRTMRTLIHSGYEANDYTGTITASANTTAVTGSGTTFTSNMVGSYMRFTSSTTTVPSGIGGLNPYTEQRKIRTVTSATAIVLDAAVDNAYSGTKFTVSDPLDFPQYMQEAFWRSVEWNYAMLSRSSAIQESYGFYKEALTRARESDSVVDIERAIGGRPHYSDQGWRGTSLGSNVS